MSQFNLKTKEGIEQARRMIAQKRRNDAIKEFDTAIDAELDTEALEDLLKEIELLNEFQSERAKPEIIDWDNIPDVDRDWLIDPWLPANTVTMFTGEGGAGKSWLTLQAICQIACGFRDAYLDPDFKKVADVSNHRNVVFATYEDEPAEIKRRLRQLASGMPWIADSMDTIKRHLHIVDMRGIGSVWGPGIGKHIANTGDLLSAGEDLQEICKSKQAKLLVMDPLSGAFGGNENDRTAVYDFVSSFRGWGDIAKCAMLVIGHLPKSQEGRAAGFSGSTAWEASARSMWMLSKKALPSDKKTDTENNRRNADKRESQAQDPNDTRRYYWTLEHTKSNYAPLQTAIPLIKDKSGWWREAATREKAADGLDNYLKGVERTQEDTHNDMRYPV